MNLSKKCNEIRIDILKCIGSLGVGHIGGCLSIVEVLTALYYKHMNINPNDPNMEGRDRLIVSKGHAGPAVYATLANKGYFPKAWLETLNRDGTNLPSHCDMNKTPGVDMTTGSLGQGFSCAVGIAYASKLNNDNAKIYTIIGDGESQEGQIWEAAMWAGSKKLNNLIAFTDYNNLQIDGTVEEVNSIYPLKDKWEAFGFHVIEVKDGNNIEMVDEAISVARTINDKPIMVILKTVKGRGVKFIEDKKAGNHNMTFTTEEIQLAIKEIEGGM